MEKWSEEKKKNWNEDIERCAKEFEKIGMHKIAKMKREEKIK